MTEQALLTAAADALLKAVSDPECEQGFRDAFARLYEFYRSKADE